MAKDFKKAAKNQAQKVVQAAQATQQVQNTHDTQSEREEQTVQAISMEQNVQEEQAVQDTQDTYKRGTKGHKAQRINMAFSAENLEYIRIYSRVQGVSCTEFVNRLIDKDRAANAERYAQAKAFLG
jgi:predicted DNA binding CopG/RHH family protein